VHVNIVTIAVMATELRPGEAFDKLETVKFWDLPIRTDAELGFTGTDTLNWELAVRTDADLGFTGTDTLNWELAVRTDADLAHQFLFTMDFAL
jgi:hypothetical protein